MIFVVVNVVLCPRFDGWIGMSEGGHVHSLQLTFSLFALPSPRLRVTLPRTSPGLCVVWRYRRRQGCQAHGRERPLQRSGQSHGRVRVWVWMGVGVGVGAASYVACTLHPEERMTPPLGQRLAACIMRFF